MIIAVPYEKEQVFQHFGKTETFKFYKVSKHAIINTEMISVSGSGHGKIVDILKEKEIDILICGGIGSGAQDLLKQNGIQFFGGVTGKTDKAVNDYLMGSLQYDADIRCDHHDSHN
ncbi:NifB/NifX family molybdenum-iron cluster-binding protein [Pectinatus haikarae]|uniref:Fe-Mo cluster-binding NifX family protein n=1 Tax=Pectinatus haikarae TaxID=349096 RepID=A0ABT9YAJ1_9FIRM|nr:NifB/NifX family molybdenum-iron cluster-binding protein [Pectinatus haikarae]MDQ0204222.1 putative Fe-Mo cluster-binding NifX family protein [Pectinatus haikarae]